MERKNNLFPDFDDIVQQTENMNRLFLETECAHIDYLKAMKAGVDEINKTLSSIVKGKNHASDKISMPRQ